MEDGYSLWTYGFQFLIITFWFNNFLGLFLFFSSSAYNFYFLISCRIWWQMTGLSALLQFLEMKRYALVVSDWLPYFLRYFSIDFLIQNHIIFKTGFVIEWAAIFFFFLSRKCSIFDLNQWKLTCVQIF